MRLLHVVPTYLPAVRYGGPIWAVHGLCRALARRGHSVTVYTTNVDGPGDSPVTLDRSTEIDGVQVRYFPSRWLRRLYWSPAMAARLDEEIARFDLVHLHSVFLWPTWAAARRARRSGRPYVLSPHGMLVPDLVERRGYWRKTAWIRLIERANVEGAAAIHAMTSLEARELERFGLRLPPVFVVPCGIDPPRDTSPPEPPTEPQSTAGLRPQLVSLGRVNWKKGLERLVQALAFVPDADLVIAGNDEENHAQELRALASRHGVLPRVRFVGPVHGASKAQLLRGATLFVLPSYSENFGLVVLEAMSEGVPVVVTPEVGLADEVAEAGAGLVVDGDPAVLGRAISSLLEHPERLREMGARGRRIALERFTWDSVAMQMERALDGVVARGYGRTREIAEHA